VRRRERKEIPPLPSNGGYLYLNLHLNLHLNREGVNGSLSLTLSLTTTHARFDGHMCPPSILAKAGDGFAYQTCSSSKDRPQDRIHQSSQRIPSGMCGGVCAGDALLGVEAAQRLHGVAQVERHAPSPASPSDIVVAILSDHDQGAAWQQLEAMAQDRPRPLGPRLDCASRASRYACSHDPRGSRRIS